MSILRRGVFAVVAVAGLSVAPPAQADLLTFDGNICAAASSGVGLASGCSDGTYINQTYGDTGVVNVAYADANAPGTSLLFWTTGYNTLTNVAYAPGNSSVSSAAISLVPIAGQQVTLNSFQLGAWPATERGSNLLIRDAVTNATLLDYGTETVGMGNVPNSYSPAITSANGLIISWFNDAYNVGIDNIDFTVSAINPGTQVPEPASLTVLGAGLLGLAFARRRR